MSNLVKKTPAGLSKHAFDFNLAGLQTYTDQTGGLLLLEAVTKARTVEIGNLQVGIKGTQEVNLMTSTLNIGAGGCGWSPSGVTTFTQAPITVCNYMYQESLCPDALLNYWQSAFLNAGSYVESVPFEEQIMKLKVEQIQAFVETKLWQALPASSGGTDCFTGFEGLFSKQSPDPVNFVVSPTTGLTNSTLMQAVDEVISTLPDAIQQRDSLVVMMSIPNYRKYQINLRNSNWYAFTPESREAGFPQLAIQHPGTGIMVYGVPGLSGSNQIVAGDKNELIIGMDLMSDSERIEAWWDQNDGEVRFRGKFKAGVTIPFPQNWASNGLA
jgi:hypothetical protein